MARSFHYADAAPPVQVQQPGDYRRFLKEHGRHTFIWGMADLQSQGAFANLTIANTRWEMAEEANWDWRQRYESEAMFRRFLDKRQFLTVFVGADNRREETNNRDADGNKILENKNLATAGLTYMLPMLITAEGRIDHKGHLRLQLSRHDLALTRRAALDFSINSDREYIVGLGYRLARNLALKGSYDSDYGWGAGLSFIY